MTRSALVGILLIGYLLLHTGCISTLPKIGALGPKTYKKSIDNPANGNRRNYLVHIPSNYNPQKSLPLVVVIHGSSDTAKGIEKISGFSDLADREEFIALYPNGRSILGSQLHWNAGHCCGKAADENWDDVGFIARVIEDAGARLNIDAERIYMVGYSDGGMLAYRFAAERGELLAAVAPLAASMGGKPSGNSPEWRIPEPQNPLSLITIHGLADDIIPYRGGISRHMGKSHALWSVEESIDYWIIHNSCNPKAANTYFNNKSVLLEFWGVCENQTEVALYKLKDWGHLWPGRYFTANLPEDNPLRDFDAAEIIWDFFKTHRRQP